MTRLEILSIIGASVFALFLAIAPAQALNAVSYVSPSGNNNNDCSHALTACYSIVAAFAKTYPGGEIKCLDGHQDGNYQYGYGPLVIEKPVTLDCGASGTAIYWFGSSSNEHPAITVNLNEGAYPNGVVTLRNLSINGLLGNGVTDPGMDGIRILGGGAAVHIENVTIQGFGEQGIDFRPSSSVDLFVRDTNITNNAAGGIFILPAAGASVRGSLSNVRIAGNGSVGLLVAKASGAAAGITVEGSQFEKNSIGLRSSGASAFILLKGSLVAHNGTGLQPLASGKIVSGKDNMIFLNATNGAPTSTLAPQ
jgi:hypothetical protein